MSVIPIETGHQPHMQDLLRQADPEASTGGSTRGWSALQLPGRCWRLAYYKLVKGLRPKRPSQPMDTGTLYHACMEAHFKSGGRDTYKPLEAVQDQLPDVAWTVRRCIEARMKKFARLDADTWDVRAIEHESLNYIEGVPSFGQHAGRKIKAPISSKFDLVLAKRVAGAPPHPAGPVKDGAMLFDFKTTGRLTREKIRGFGMDAQLTLMALNWRLGRLDKVFGPLQGFILEIIVTTKEVGLERLEIIITDEDIDRFYASLKPWAIELESMLAVEDRDDQELWPMNFAGCISGAYGACKFFDLCESHGTYDSEYEVTPGFVPARGLVRQEAKAARPKATRRKKHVPNQDSPTPTEGT